MLRKATSIKGLFLSQRAFPDTNRGAGWQQNYHPLTRGTISSFIALREKNSTFTNSVKSMKKYWTLWESSFNSDSFSPHSPSVPRPLLPASKQESALLLYESPYWHHTANRSPSTHKPSYPPTHPPSNSLFCSALLSLALAFSAKSQIGGWGVFCGPNKRAKVVRTPLYKSVWGGGGVGVESGVRRGGGGQWPKQLVFQAWVYTD